MIILKHNFFIKQASSLIFYKKLILPIYIFISINIFAQESKISKLLYIQPEFHYGGFMKNSHKDNAIFPNYYTAIDIKIGIQTKGNNWWHKEWDYPSYGVGIYKGFYNNPEVLGSPLGVYVFFNGSFFKTKRLSFNYEFGSGLGFLDKYYSNSENNMNDVVSTPVEYFANLKVNFAYKISERIDYLIGGHLSHFSNGALKMPNYGLNMLGLNTSIKYYFNSKKSKNNFNRNKISTTIEMPDFKKNTFSFSYGIGARTNTGNYDYPLYLMWSISASYLRRYSKIASYGGGLDLFYVGNMHTVKGYENYKPIERLMYGIHFSHLLHINKLDFITDIGSYLINRDYNGFIWARIGAKYNITKHFFAQIGFKTQNGAKADYIELAIGIKI